jgi:hypothetical protein
MLRLLLPVGELLPVWVGVRESVISPPTGDIECERAGRKEKKREREDVPS